MNEKRKVMWILITGTTAMCIFSLYKSPINWSTERAAVAYGERSAFMKSAKRAVGFFMMGGSTTMADAKSGWLGGTHVVLDDGTEVVYQRAATSRAAGSVLFFHGCQHSSTDYWEFGEYCLGCIGLPEEVRMIQLTLQRNLNAVAISSTNRERKCWSTRVDAKGPDYDRVKSTMKFLKDNEIHSDDMDLYAVGASSGGTFVTTLHAILKLQAVNTIVAGSVAAALSDARWEIPAHAFTHMAGRDGHTKGRIAENSRWLKDQGVEVMERRVFPRKLSAEWLSESVPRWDLNLTNEVISALKANKLIDEGSGELACDPRSCDWRKAVEHLKPRLNDSMIADQSALSEELNRAWAAHESSADFFEDVLDFFAAHGRAEPAA